MLKEAIDRLTELGSEAAGVQLVKLANRKVIVRHGSSHEVMELDPAPRKHVAETLDGFVSLLDALSGEHALVFVGDCNVIAVLDNETRDDLVMIPLTQSRALRALLELSEPTPQKVVISKLREELWGCCEERLLAVIRRLDFTRNSDGRSHITHGRESLGRSVEAAVQSSEGDVPEFVMFTLPAFSTSDFPMEISLRCAVNVDATTEKISFRITGEDLVREITEVRQRIAQLITDSLSDETVKVSASVVVGSP